MCDSTVHELFEKIDCVMTDSAPKCSKFEKSLAKQLKADHVPLHLFCTTHTTLKLEVGKLIFFYFSYFRCPHSISKRVQYFNVNLLSCLLKNTKSPS